MSPCCFRRIKKLLPGELGSSLIIGLLPESVFEEVHVVKHFHNTLN